MTNNSSNSVIPNKNHPSFRFGHSACSINAENIIICGGYDGTRQLNDVWNFNYQNNK